MPFITPLEAPLKMPSKRTQPSKPSEPVVPGRSSRKPTAPGPQGVLERMAQALPGSTTVSVDGETLTLEQVERVALGGAFVALTDAARQRMAESRNVVEGILAAGAPVYGITTGFGKFKDTYIKPEDSRELQRNLLLSHAAGVGDPLDQPAVRAMMLLRANALAKGLSGIRPEVVDLLIECLNRGVHPIIPCQGSVGASGDLCPLAHLSLVLIGQGQAEYNGYLMPGGEALSRAQLSPVTLEAKEGLALTNGTQLMAAVGALTLLEAERLAKTADVVGAMSLEAQLGSARAFSEKIHAARPHPGQLASAANLRRLLAGSKLMESHAACGMVQDAYSLRCMPQVHGASRQAFASARCVLEIEVNSATDNPLVFPDEVLSGGNFHGQPLALAMDYLAIALAELANISERRIERLVNASLSNGLPPFLTTHGGLNSGLMVGQYTAAALVSENKALSHPASVDSIPTSANQEDHVSMGPIAARKARQILQNARRVLAIELICASQGLDFRLTNPGLTGGPAGEIKPSPAVVAAHRLVRSRIPHLEEDRELCGDIAQAEALISSALLLQVVEEAIGPLH